MFFEEVGTTFQETGILCFQFFFKFIKGCFSVIGAKSAIVSSFGKKSHILIQRTGSPGNAGMQQIVEVNLNMQTITRVYIQVFRIIAKSNLTSWSIRTETETESTVIRYGRSVNCFQTGQIRYLKFHLLLLRINFPVKYTARDYHFFRQIFMTLLSLTV